MVTGREVANSDFVFWKAFYALFASVQTECEASPGDFDDEILLFLRIGVPDMILGGDMILRQFEISNWTMHRGQHLVPYEQIQKLINPNSINVTLGSKFIELKPGPAFWQYQQTENGEWKEWWEDDDKEVPYVQTKVDQMGWVIDPYDARSLDGREFEAESVILYERQFLLGHAAECVDCSKPVKIDGVNRYFAPMFEARSSFARMGLLAHLSAGFGDYGFGSTFTSEFANLGPAPVRLTAGMEFAQINFNLVFNGHYNRPPRYDGKYNRLQRSGPALPVLGREKFDSAMRGGALPRG